jgi:hypothetical protein
MFCNFNEQKKKKKKKNQNYGSPLPLKPSKKKLQVGLMGISFDASYVEDVRN